LSKVAKDDVTGCWNWTGSVDSSGYGQIRETYPSKQFIRPHRYMLEQTGVDLTGLNALHTCDNPRCCNPDHLYSGTQLENNRDTRARNRNVSIQGYRWWSNGKKKTMALDCPGEGWFLSYARSPLNA